MSHTRITLTCAECLNACAVTATNITDISFCPFCGEGLVPNYEDGDETLFDGFGELDETDTDIDF